MYQDIIKLIDDYRDKLADRRSLIEKHQYVSTIEIGYANAMTDVISELHEIIEKIKLIEQCKDTSEVD
jgi:hypothetical protein